MKVASKKDTAAECEVFSSCRFGRSCGVLVHA